MAFQKNCIACGAILKTPIYSKTGILCRSCKEQGLFRKKLIITGITRMNKNNVCISGIDPDTWNFIRPVFSMGDNLTREFAMDGSTQIIHHFNLVEMEFTNYSPDNTYHTEDWIVNENFAPKFIKRLSDSQILKVINKVAINNLDLAIQSKDKSLFIVKIKKIVKIIDGDEFGKFKVRISFIDAAGNFYRNIPVTDLLTLAVARYYNEKGNDYKSRLMNIVNNNPYKYIRIGLTRLFRGQYWKQITAIITIPDAFNGKNFTDYEKRGGFKL